MNTNIPPELFYWQAVASVAILIVAVITFLFPRLSAAYRHFLWLLALAATCLVAVFVFWTPRVDIPVLSAVPDAASREFASASGVENAAQQKAAPPVTLATNPAYFTPSVKAPIYASLNLWAALWGIGSLLIAASILFGHFRLRLLLKRGEANLELLSRLHALHAYCGFPEKAVFLVSNFVSSPFCYGLFRPIIVFPASAENWTDEQLCDCLAHETSHILRKDLWAMTLAHCVVTLCWFNPLVWFAAVRMRMAAEQACDDLVIVSRDSQRYAATLIDLVEVCSRRSLLDASVVMPMFRESALRPRVHHLLATGCSRRPVSSLMGTCCFIVCVLLLFGITSIRLVAAPAEKVKEPAKSPADVVSKQQKEIRIQVLDEQKRPVQGARVNLYTMEKIDGGTRWTGPNDGKTWKTNSDGIAIATNSEIDKINFVSVSARGFILSALAFDIQHPQPVILEKGARFVFRAVSASDGKSLRPYVYGFGEMPLWTQLSWERGGDGQSLEVNLPKGSYTISGFSVDPSASGFSNPQVIESSGNGEQVVELKVEPPYKITGRLDDSVPRPVRNGKVIVSIDAKGGKPMPLWSASCKIQPDGSFDLGSCPEGAVQLVAICDGYVSVSSPDFKTPDPMEALNPQCFPADSRMPLEIAMLPTAKIVVHVRDTAGSPVQGAQVGFAVQQVFSYRSKSFAASNLDDSPSSRKTYVDAEDHPDVKPGNVCPPNSYCAVTDEKGEAVIVNLPPGKHTIYAIGTGYEKDRNIIEVKSGETASVEMTMEKKKNTSVSKQQKEIRIQVLDEQKRPVTGASVYLYEKHSDSSGFTMTPIGSELKTDGQGTAVAKIDQYLSLPNFAYIYATGFAPVGRSVDAHHPEPLLLEKGTKLTVRMINEEGKPARPYIYGFRELSNSLKLSWKRSDDGYVLETNLPKGKYSVAAVDVNSSQMEFSEARWLEVSGSGEEKIELKGNPGTNVSGKLNANIPRPIRNGYVIACVDTGSGKSGDAKVGWYKTSEIQADGSFELNGIPSSANPLQIIAICDGYVSVPSSGFSLGSVTPQNFPINPKTPLEIAMVRTGAAEIQLKNTKGEPVSSKMVWMRAAQAFFDSNHDLGTPVDTQKELVARQNGAFDRNYHGLFTSYNYSATTDKNGRVSVPHLPPDTIGLGIVEGDYKIIKSVPIKNDEPNIIEVLWDPEKKGGIEEAGKGNPQLQKTPANAQHFLIKDEPIEIWADGKTYFDKGMAMAKDNVRISYKDIKISAGSAAYSPETRIVQLRGKVKVTAPNVFLDADFNQGVIVYNLETGELWTADDAAEKDKARTYNFKDIAVEITADDTQFKNGVAIATKDVRARYYDFGGVADYSEYNPKNRDILLKGNVRIYTPNYFFSGSQALYNMETKQLRAGAGEIRISANSAMEKFSKLAVVGR